MTGIIFSIIAGIFVSLQGVFNTRVSEKIGQWETNAIVHGTGFLLALIIMVISNSGNFQKAAEVNKFYFLGGVFGVIIIFSVMKGISQLGAAYSVAILLITQLAAATVIDTLGLFGSPQIKLDYTKPVGLIIMIVGIIVFKIKG